MCRDRAGVLLRFCYWSAGVFRQIKMHANRIVTDAIRRAYRGFLAKVHPDYYSGDGDAQKTNVALIQSLSRPLDEILHSWMHPHSSLKLSSGCTIVNFYTTKAHQKGPTADSYRLPFELSEASRNQGKPAASRTLSSLGVLQFFNYTGVAVEADILQYLRRTLSDEMQKQGANSVAGKFHRVYDDYTAETSRLAAAPADLYDPDVLGRVASRPYIRIDCSLGKGEKRAALASLVSSIGEIERAEKILGPSMPVLFVSRAAEYPALTKDSVRVPPTFSPDRTASPPAIGVCVDWGLCCRTGGLPKLVAVHGACPSGRRGPPKHPASKRRTRGLVAGLPVSFCL